MAELVGITEAAIWEEVHPGLPVGTPELNNLKAVAMAAQRALLREIIYHDYPGQLLDLQDKLEVTP